jgi:hypothetical protein
MPDRGYHDYLSALAVIGLPAGSSIEAIRDRHRERIRLCHPDHFPGDPAKLEEAQRLNAAKDTLEAMSVDGRLATYTAVAERERRTTPGSSVPFIVRTIMAPAGAGKTLGWVLSITRLRIRRRAVLVPTVLRVIMAAPTIALLEQTAFELKKRKLDSPVVTVIHSEKPEAKEGVAPAMREYYGKLEATHDAVLLCTHQAIFDTPLPPEPQNWDITFDEMPECVTFLAIDAPTTHVYITARVIKTELEGQLVGLVSLAPDPASMDDMNNLLRIATNHPHDDGLVHLQDLARALVRGHSVIVPADQWAELTVRRKPRKTKSIYNGHLDVLVIVPPVWFHKYRSVTMMGARCLSHFTALIWQRLYQVEFRETNPFGLPTAHSATQCERVTINWIFEERATRAYLDRKAERGGKLFMAACESVATFYRGRRFLWSAPQPGEDKPHAVANDFWVRHTSRHPGAFNTLLRLPGKTHGLNRPEFIKATNVALLSVVNLTPEQYELLYQLNLTKDEIDRALAFDVIYQDALRCNLRNKASKRRVSITVLDQATAMELAAKFPGCRVQRYPERLVPVPANPRRRGGRPGPAPSGKAKTGAERQRKWHEVQKAKRRAQRQEARRES